MKDQPIRRWLARFHVSFSKLNRQVILLIVSLLMVLLGYADYITGFEVSFSFFYLIPIAIATWYINITSGYIFTALSIILWVMTNKMAGEVYSRETIWYFNALIRLLVFLMISSLLNELKIALQHAQNLARTDYLTGAVNSREFYVRADLEIQRADRYKFPLSLAYFDLDSFKAVNDVYGHSEGDRQLKVISESILAVMRKTDIFARLGGDEFALLLPETDQPSAMAAVQKIQKAVMDKMLNIQSPVTMSVGVVTFNIPPKSVKDLIEPADALMYQAKKLGKDKILNIQL